MNHPNIIFITGLHRSGTSILHEIIRSHPKISGMLNTGVPEDEGQHLQSVFSPAYKFGGPGKFAFNPKSYMDEFHPLATPANAVRLLEEWKPFFDFSKQYIVEKSPPSIIRTRFLQQLFPGSKFIVILRHPLAISYATQKWSRTSIRSLLKHTLNAYDLFFKDRSKLGSVFVLRYEDFVENPQKIIDEIFDFLHLETIEVDKDIRKNVNQKYFSLWEQKQKKWITRMPNYHLSKFEGKMQQLEYSLLNYTE